MITLEKQVMSKVNHQENYNKIETAINEMPREQYIKVNIVSAGEFIVTPSITTTHALSLDESVEVTKVEDSLIHIKASKSTNKAVIYATNNPYAIEERNAEYA